jgi:hypothetical protein
MTTMMVGDKPYFLVYKRLLPKSEVMKMKSFKTITGERLLKTAKFKIKKVQNIYEENNSDDRIYYTTKGSFMVV